MTEPLDELFGEHYLHFHASRLSEQLADDEAAELVGLLGLGRGSVVLDAGCGEGRIAVRLAASGLGVTAVDRSESFLAAAARRCAERGVQVELVVGELEQLPVSGPFDAAVLWFNTFGFLDDQGNATVLSELRRVLRPGGVLVVDTLNRDAVVRHHTAAPDVVVVDVGGDLQLDASAIDVLSGRLVVDRTIVRSASVFRSSFSQRLLTVPEWRRLLADSGFADVEVCGRAGEALTLDSWELVLRAVAA